MSTDDGRARVLAAHGAGPAETAELLAYNRNPFDPRRVQPPPTFPLPAEPSVETWERYAEEADRLGAFEVLRRCLPQLRFPIQEGISQSDAYRAATRRGVAPEALAEATGLALRAPDTIRLVIHRGLAGPIPVLIAGERPDFVALVRALAKRNEPWPVPDAMGACMVRGFNNWDRVRTHRRAWEGAGPTNRGDDAWDAEFARLRACPDLYQDRFVVLSDGPYSGVPATAVGLGEAEWRRVSLAIRLEHEATHYLTLRVYSEPRNNALDEVSCDYQGIVAGAGRFRADWLRRFLGLEAYPSYRAGGRLEHYLGEPPLSAGAFRVLRSLVNSAADALERFDAGRPAAPGLAERGAVLLGLTRLTLEDLAAEDGAERLARAVSGGAAA